MIKELYKLTIKEALDLLNKREITSVELTQACIDRIKEKDKEINAFITTTFEAALEKAKQVDLKREKGEKLGALAGIPYSLKDVYNTKGVRTTAGSKILENHVAQYDASVVKRLDEADAVLLGKTNCDPFGFGSTTEHSHFGVTRNPIDPSRVPGGSSGGSGAAVAYGGGLFSIGEDTGGSIRCPASFCGVVGMKVTYGRVSRYGSIAYASSYDTVGPLTKNVEDNAIVLKVIAGQDRMDATTSDKEVPDYVENLNKSIEGKIIGLPKEYFGDGLSPAVKEVVMEAVERFKKLGCKVVEISLPYTKYAIAAYYVVGTAETSSNLARFDGIRYGYHSNGKNWQDIIMKTRGEGFGPEEKRRIMVGTYSLSAGYADEYYKKAQKVRMLIKEDLLKTLNKVDIILTPTMPDLPYKIGENEGDPLKLWLADAFTVTLNPSGLPGLAVPAGLSKKEHLPVGMQLIGKHFSEAELYNFAYQYENGI